MEKKRGGGSMMLQNCMKRRRRLSTRAKPPPSLPQLSSLSEHSLFQNKIRLSRFSPTVKGENMARDWRFSVVRKHVSDATKRMSAYVKAQDHVGTFNALVLTIPGRINFEARGSAFQNYTQYVSKEPENEALEELRQQSLPSYSTCQLK